MSASLTGYSPTGFRELHPPPEPPKDPIKKAPQPELQGFCCEWRGGAKATDYFTVAADSV
uniref:Uncharacterized protein n=1 Tax=Curvibacter symbiont subsp. Hydra magnipapillata TaxID=667019 RepID=C9Y9Q1_CURXX|nr:hypothetical protein Csp_A08520 [Curvibacter putative symbiont of Hydra magnipapillata]